MLDNQVVTVHSNGINKDRSYKDKNDVTFALNCIRNSHEGGRQEYQSEPGNITSAQIPTNYNLVGSIYGQDDETYIFSTNGERSEVGVYKNDTYTTVVNVDCLGFSTQHPITGEYRVRNGCNRTIYWSDGFNSDYWFDLDNPNSFKVSGVFDCNKFKHAPAVLPPKVDLLSVNDFGGILPLGSFYFQPEILDENLNSIYLGEITPQVIVYDEPQSLNYYNIDGGLNIEQYDPAIGGVPLTNKSISLRFSQLLTTFKYLRVNVFRSISGTSVISAHSVGKLIPIGSTSVDWTYQGYDPGAGDFPIDTSEKLIDNILYDSAYVMEQVQGRLLKANLRQSNVDYSEYQAAASKITAKWVSTEHRSANINELGDPKNPKTYWYKRGYQGDEVYLPGIMYLHTNGTQSPVFPLVGRSATPTDLQLLTVINNADLLGATDVWLSDAEHLGLEIGDTVERWKVFNTATITGSQTVTSPYSYEGEFSYFETDETYPDIKDCDDNLVWGTDADDNLITTSTKVRLFKFPDRRLLPHMTRRALVLWLRSFGIQFGNITYPSPDIIGHKFVMAERTEFDKTVVDSGWANTPRVELSGATVVKIESFTQSSGGQEMFHHFNPFTSSAQNKYIRYVSPKTLYDKNLGNFDYYKTNNASSFDTGLVANDGKNSYAKESLDNIVIHSIILNMNFEESELPLRTNHSEKESVLVNAGAIISSTGLFPKIQSYDYYTSDTISYVNRGLESTTSLLPPQIYDTWVTNPTDTRIKVHNFYTYKKSSLQPYNNFLTKNYVGMSNNFVYSLLTADNILYGGDTLVNEGNNFRLNYFLPVSLTGDAFAFTPFFKDHFVETSINTALRHEGTVIENKYFNVGDSDEVNYERLIVDRSLPIFDQQPRSRSEIIPEYYAYNPDYNIRLFEKAKGSLPNTFDYCSRCDGYYPNRIIFSPKSFDEEVFDLYRVNKVNDYIDIPGHRGAITGLKHQNNQLLVHCEDTTFVLQPNPQQIQTDQNTAYLGTGDFLSIPPQELMQTDVGFGGLQNKQSMTDTPFGHCWVDQKRGDVLSWNGQIKMLTTGLTQWFKEYLPSELKKEYFRITGIEYPIKSTLNTSGYGVILYYDPRFKRLMVSKRDFLPLNFKLTAPILPGLFSLFNETNETSEWYTIIDSVSESVYPHINGNFENPFSLDYFQDKSWTLSYDLEDESWCSWHSYIPYHAFSDSINFYTTNYNRNIWKHLHKTRYQKYYGFKYDMVLEWMSIDGVSSSIDNVYYVGYSQIWDTVNQKFKTVDTTFDRLVIYNSEQTTGLQNLVLMDSHINPYGNNKLPNNSKTVIRTDQNYKIAGLYDMSIGQPTMTDDWNLKKLYFGYIDEAPNTAVINFNKSYYDWGNILDKFAFVRLFYNPALDHKKTVILQVLHNQQSLR